MAGEDRIGKVKAIRGKEHDYLGMKLVYAIDGELKVDMIDYIQENIKEFPEELSGRANTPWNDHLFKVNKNDIELNKKHQKLFHSLVM